MPKQGKSPKKKTKEKSPQRTEESEYPEMDQDVYNRLLQNAIEQSKAELQQRHEEQLKAVEERLTRKFDDEVRELSREGMQALEAESKSEDIDASFEKATALLKNLRGALDKGNYSIIAQLESL